MGAASNDLSVILSVPNGEAMIATAGALLLYLERGGQPVKRKNSDQHGDSNQMEQAGGMDLERNAILQTIPR